MPRSTDDRPAWRRRALLGAATKLTGLAAAGSAAAQSPGAVPKSVAKYQDHPNGAHHCAGCVNFVAPASCHVVAGRISPDGWCQYFTPKQ